MKLAGQLLSVSELSSTDQHDMFRLMDRHYAHVQKEAFDADLAEKRWVIQVRSQDTGELCGFSTQMVLDAEVDGRSIKALFSGDTIIDREHWGDPVLAYIGGQLALSLVDKYPGDDFFWFLISAGYKTYRFLPVFFREFYPRHNQATPPFTRRVIDTLAQQKFAERYDSATGIVRASVSQYHLRSGVADATPERQRDSDVQFFVERNPGHSKGDELCCLARLSRNNFTDAAYRVLRSDK